MARLKIPPTKSALLDLRRRVDFLEQGHAMLERKKELLTRLVYDRLNHYRQLRGEVRRGLEEAYRWLGIGQARMGSQVFRQIATGMRPGIAVTVLPRSHLGVEYPSVTATPLPLQPVGLLGTDPSLDETRTRLTDTAVLLARLGEAETALWRLLEEQRKTQKRVNALKYNIIPRYHETIAFIEASLEEEERSALFQVKVLREKRARAK
ncbi:MAG: V-type ATP synthase subunit D [Alphaproteobacteria bacterium CG_4_10_14_0_2_um_filter_63_37]|nr:MAG: V-type ATP synthase subunit D [Proteobacteria bacterium CG1_02_64_396]PJA24364.1 MAG: V-type ATP synthase subunit D [Alphaproteobacteria bacterium CG_4_10_14_0_2_um_filter_63_37]